MDISKNLGGIAGSKCYLFIFLLTLILSNSNLYGQQIKMESLANDFESYVNVPEEIAYVHINKSMFLFQEDIAFSGYIIDKKTQLPSIETTNVYAQLIDKNYKVIKEQLLLAKMGKVNGIFTVDSLVGPGDYNLKLYTNWMKNFDNPNYGSAPLTVVATTKEVESSNQTTLNYDLQLLPEAGKPIHNVFTKVGVIAKNQYGIGKTGTLTIYKNKKPFNKIVLDDNGIASFMWLPDMNANWKVTLDIDDNIINAPMPIVERNGVQLTCNVSDKKVGIGVSTNKETHDILKSKKFDVIINGSNQFTRSSLNLSSLEKSFSIPLNELQPGANQISLVDNTGNLISRRVFFNHHSFKFVNDINVNASTDLDSVQVAINIPKQTGNISVSVLPTETVSSVTNRGIVQKLKFSPYLRGKIQDISGYFPLNSAKKIQAMDNLFVCQGWEVYDWDNITNTSKTKFNHAFERGITVEGIANTDDYDNILFYSGNRGKTQIVELDNNKSFTAVEYVPSQNEQLKLSGLNKNGQAEKVGIYPRFTPSRVPKMSKLRFRNPSKQDYVELSDVEFLPFSNLNQVLDTVSLEFRTNKRRQDSIKNLTYGRVDFFDDSKRRAFFTLEQYLQQWAFSGGGNGTFGPSYGAQNNDRVIIIDDFIAFDQDIQALNMATVDYIEFDFTGRNWFMGQDLNGPVIKITTNPSLIPESDRKTISSYEVPLTFTEPKDFYRPKYVSYTSEMFKKIGVIDWHGDVSVINGVANITIPNYGLTEVKVTIEGMSENGNLIQYSKNARIK